MGFGWVRLCIFLQVGLLKCTFPSGSLSALVRAGSKIRLGLLYGLLRVGLLSRGLNVLGIVSETSKKWAFK